MKKILFILLMFVLFNNPNPTNPSDDDPSVDRHMGNVTQLTFEGDNGEAYFSKDDTKLIFQYNRGGESCDKIWVMNIDGSGKQRVSPDHGAHTCAYFFPDGRKVLFASTSTVWWNSAVP